MGKGETTARLLILDDDPHIAETVAAIASTVSVESLIAQCPAHFFTQLEHWRPTHIFLDLQMPGMDGLEILEELAKRSVSASIILSSGVGARVLAAAELTAKELGLNCCGALTKPFAMKALRALLQSAVDEALTEDRRPLGEEAPHVRVIDKTRLREAIERDEIVNYYQPKFSCLNGVVHGVEVLVRWQHPEYGLLGPGSFIPLAENSGLIDQLTIHVYTQALNDFGAWMRQRKCPASLHPQPTIAINLSARSLNTPELTEQLFSVSRDASVDPQRVIFELTETAAMEDPVAALGLLTRLRVQGFRLSLDDFGTGYSSMIQLVRQPFSELKIDKSFVMTAMHSEESRAIIRTTVDLGHSLRMQVTAEGVEDKATLHFLQDCHCDHAQGFLIARPMSLASLTDWLLDYSEQRVDLFRIA